MVPRLRRAAAEEAHRLSLAARLSGRSRHRVNSRAAGRLTGNSLPMYRLIALTLPRLCVSAASGLNEHCVYTSKA